MLRREYAAKVGGPVNAESVRTNGAEIELVGEPAAFDRLHSGREGERFCKAAVLSADELYRAASIAGVAGHGKQRQAVVRGGIVEFASAHEGAPPAQAIEIANR